MRYTSDLGLESHLKEENKRLKEQISELQEAYNRKEDEKIMNSEAQKQAVTDLGQ